MRIISLTLAALAFTAFAAEPNTLSEEEKAAGWKLLFDGKTTAGWRAIGKKDFPSKGWVAEDGTLKHIAKGGGGDIVTVEDFESFEFTWDWKIAKAGNSGVKYNLVNPNNAVGCEYQLLDDEGHPDGKRGGRLHQTAGLYDLIEPPADRKVNAVGEWNSSRLVVNGNKVEHWLNGAKTVEFELGSDALKTLVAKSKYKNAAGFGVKKAGPILLQDHGDECAFRNIKIRVLKP
jgi:Domain of Unknown Function (DUF1080)